MRDEQDKQIKTVTRIVEQHAQNHRRIAESRRGHEGGGNAGTSMDRIKPPKLDRSTYWTIEALTIHSDWTSRENTTHHLVVL
jgi:hypothetical protein